VPLISSSTASGIVSPGGCQRLRASGGRRLFLDDDPGVAARRQIELPSASRLGAMCRRTPTTASLMVVKLMLTYWRVRWAVGGVECASGADLPAAGGAGRGWPAGSPPLSASVARAHIWTARAGGSRWFSGPAPGNAMGSGRVMSPWLGGCSQVSPGCITCVPARAPGAIGAVTYGQQANPRRESSGTFAWIGPRGGSR